MSLSVSLQGTDYYVQVSAYNMKGWGPPLGSTPACAAPSSKYVFGDSNKQRCLVKWSFVKVLEYLNGMYEV